MTLLRFSTLIAFCLLVGTGCGASSSDISNPRLAAKGKRSAKAAKGQKFRGTKSKRGKAKRGGKAKGGKAKGKARRTAGNSCCCIDDLCTRLVPQSDCHSNGQKWTTGPQCAPICCKAMPVPSIGEKGGEPYWGSTASQCMCGSCKVVRGSLCGH